MARPDITFCALLGLMAFTSCVPKAVVVQQPPSATPKKEEKKETVPEPALADTPPPLPDDGGIRMPNFLELPNEGELRTQRPGAVKAEPGAVISRPPTDPPSRVKPKPQE